MGVKQMRDVVAHYICPTDRNLNIECMGDVERVMQGLGYGKTERFETSEGSWLRFSCTSTACANSVKPSPPPQGCPPQSPSEFAYHLKLPIHLHVPPHPQLHFRPFVLALTFFTGKLVFHLKNVDCEEQHCKFLTSCKELYGYQRAPSDCIEY